MLFLTVLFWLLVGHALADYPLQGDFLARAKNRHSAFPGIHYVWGLFWHAVIHAGAVAFFTGSVRLGVAEFICHVFIDLAKCENRTTFTQDQMLHIVCKILWAGLVVSARPGVL